ncbi:MAG: polysaccharide biosynthesis protein [Bacilli bacterium]|nr:polysaccharide biosynthesis protein [Bacilli bacterium]
MKLKKNTFMQGAFIASMGIVISKILGIMYVIPFYAIIGEQGGALYGYAYNIYSIFLSLSTAGVPLAVSKIISEYNALGYYKEKERAFKIAKRLLTIIGVICFLVLFIFAREIAMLIIGNVEGGNTLSDVTAVIRVISFSILVVPILSVYRGYLQGHKYITPTSVSQILEQIVRVTIIIVGSYLSLRLFNLGLPTAVGVALFGATVGSLCSYLYLVNKVFKNKKQLNIDANQEERASVTTKEIIMKILCYSLPFVFGDLFKSLYNSVDTFLLIRTLVNGLGFAAIDAESIMSVISTWGNKLNMIVIAVGTGFTVSIIPNITYSLVKKDYKDIKKKINKTFKITLFVTLPMVVGLSFLSEPVWQVFYGASKYGPKVFSFSIFTALLTVTLSLCTTILLTLKDYKIMFTTLIIGLITNAILDVPLIYLFNYLKLPPYYGATAATILGNLVSIIIVIVFLYKKYDIDFFKSYKLFFKIISSIALMLLGLTLLKYIVPFSNDRIVSLFITILYSLVGAAIYFCVTFKTKAIHEVFGNNIFDVIKKKLKLNNLKKAN